MSTLGFRIRFDALRIERRPERGAASHDDGGPPHANPPLTGAPVPRHKYQEIRQFDERGPRRAIQCVDGPQHLQCHRAAPQAASPPGTRKHDAPRAWDRTPPARTSRLVPITSVTTNFIHAFKASQDSPDAASPPRGDNPLRRSSGTFRSSSSVVGSLSRNGARLVTRLESPFHHSTSRPVISPKFSVGLLHSRGRSQPFRHKFPDLFGPRSAFGSDLRLSDADRGRQSCRLRQIRFIQEASPTNPRRREPPAIPRRDSALRNSWSIRPDGVCQERLNTFETASLNRTCPE